MITEFKGEYRYLSNFAPCDITYQGVVYPSVENAYQASKCKNTEDRKQFIDITPGEAKRLARKLPLRDDWRKDRIAIMESLLKQKFTADSIYGERLIQTGDVKIKEGNYWSDTFWGVDIKTLRGQNNLGKLIMKIREELSDGSVQAIAS